MRFLVEGRVLDRAEVYETFSPSELNSARRLLTDVALGLAVYTLAVGGTPFKVTVEGKGELSIASFGARIVSN